MTKHTNKQYVQMFRNGDMSKVQDFSEQFGITVEAAEEIAKYIEGNGMREGLNLRRRDDAPFVRISVTFNTRVHGMRAKDGRMFVTKNGKIVIRH
jgi:hypothetical protein